MTTLVKKVYDIADLQKKGHCVRPERGTVGVRVTAAVEQLLQNTSGQVPLDFITYAGAAVYLRGLRKKDSAKYGDVALATKNGKPTVYIHGCWDINNGRKFIRQNDMTGAFGQRLVVSDRLNATMIQAVKIRFGVGEFWPGKSMQDTAKVMGLTRARVGQLLTAALAELGFEPRWRLS